MHVHFPEFVRKDGPSAGRDDGDQPRQRADEGAGEARSRHDRRDHAPRPRDADRRGQGEAPRGSSKRHHARSIIPKENRKDLREVPRRVLKATRIVLVEHMDEVLREALCLPDPNALFGPPRETWEYIDGELVTRAPRPGELPAGRTPDPAPVPANA